MSRTGLPREAFDGDTVKAHIGAPQAELQDGGEYIETRTARNPASEGHIRKKGTQSANRISSLLLGLMALQTILLPIYYLRADDLTAPDIFREYGVVGNTTKALNKLGSHNPLAIPVSIFLRTTIRLNPESQTLAASQGALKIAADLIEEDGSFSQARGMRLLRDLLRDNPTVKEMVIKEGILEKLLRILKKDHDSKLTGKAAWVMANFAADGSSNRKKRASASGLVDILMGLLEINSNHKSETAVNSIWALSNLLAEAPAVQALALQSGLPKSLSKLLRSEKDKFLPPAIHATGNLAAKFSAGQDALQESGSLGALVRIIEKEVASVKKLASQPFHTEVLEHIAELQRSDAAVKDALSEVGGLEELLGIMETSSTVKQPPSAADKQLIAVEDRDNDEDEKASIRALVRDLQDEADTEAGILPDLKLPVLSRAPSGARILSKLEKRSSQETAGDAAWALSLLVADNAANQNAAREAGALEALVKLLESAGNANVANSALKAISSLVKNNPENKSAARQANGVQGLVKLLASNPADKEVLKATAQALKHMSSERPVYEVVARGGSRGLRVLGRIIASYLSALLETTVSPILGSALVLGLVSALLGSFLIFLIPRSKRL